MLVDHFRRDFIDLVVGKRVVIIAHQDVDGICTVKILTALFKTEGIGYILVSCNGISEMKVKYDDYKDQSDTFVMVNCGAAVDLLDTLENPPQEKIFFLIDFHRPIHVINYYNTTGQLKIVSAPEPEESIPEFDQIFAEDPNISDDDDEDEEDMEEDDDIDENGMTGRMRRRAEKQKRRSEHKRWLDNREKMLFKYRENSYFARPSALYALEVAWVMSRDDMDSIWFTIIALTDALVMGRLSRAKYTEFASTVNDHILRIRNAQKLPRDCLKIRFERELFLYLYRNWNIYESAKATPFVASILRTWSMEGCRKFHQLLATLGLPLVEVRQKFSSMNMQLRNELVDMFSSDTVVERFKLADLVFGSFIGEIGYRPKFNAMDVQLATLATLEDPDVGKSGETKFVDAMKILDVRDVDTYLEGIVKAKGLLKQAQSQVEMMINMKQVQEVGPFLHVQLSDCLIDFNYFKRPTAIPLLVHYLQHAGIRSGKRKWKQAPWIVMIPESQEYTIVVGVPPAAYEQADNNIFKEVFRVIQQRMQDDIISDHFEGCTILVKTAQRQAFLDQLLYISE